MIGWQNKQKIKTMVSVRLATFNRRLIITLLVFASTVMASDAPPAMLPRGFLEQLPLLMQLSQKEFEHLLKYAEDSDSEKHLDDKATHKNSTDSDYNTENYENEGYKTKGYKTKGEHDEN